MAPISRIDSSETSAGPSSPWEPFRVAAFRALWIATLITNLGGWMQDVGASWLMTALTSSPLWIALVQSAASLPIFLLALPAGAPADILPRRRILLASNVLLLTAVSALTLCTFTGHASPTMLLAFTFVVGVGEALAGPAFQAIIGDLVPKPDLVSAVSLNSVGFNLARAVGPALGGLVLARWGAGITFLVNAFSFLAVILVLWRWQERVKRSVLPSERFIGAVRAGSRYLHYSPELQTVAIRTGAFVLSASALWALLPVVVRSANQGPTEYGVLLGALGAGALVGGVLLPLMRKHLSLNSIVVAATCAFGISTLGSAFLSTFREMVVLMLLGGVGWISMVSTMNIATRVVVPAWIQARAISVYLLVLQGGLALGSVTWGLIASRFGLRTALAGAGVGLLLTVLLAVRYPLHSGKERDLDIVAKWPEPDFFPDTQHESAPVLVTVEYVITPESLREFRLEMRQMEQLRRRNGALQWGLFADPRYPCTYLEEFLVESWLEHQRQHERVTVADALLQDRIWALHIGTDHPRVVHFFAEET